MRRPVDEDRPPILCFPQGDNTPCLRVPTVPHTTDDNWPDETAINNFPVVAWGKSRKGFTARLVLVPALRPLLPSSELAWAEGHFSNGPIPLRRMAACSSRRGGANQWKEEKAVGAVETQQHTTTNRFRNTYQSSHLFLSRQCWRSILGGDGDMPSSKPIDNEWPIKPTLPTSRASNHLHSGRTYQVKDLRSV